MNIKKLANRLDMPEKIIRNLVDKLTAQKLSERDILEMFGITQIDNEQIDMSGLEAKDQIIDVDVLRQNLDNTPNKNYFPMEFFSETFLFAFNDESAQNDLDNNKISEEFRQKFKETLCKEILWGEKVVVFGREISDNATVMVEKKGHKWIVIVEEEDANHTKQEYIIRKGKEKISVYEHNPNNYPSWYSGNLFALREPLLFNNRENKEIYRFTWLRTFHAPIAIRIEKSDAENIIIWKVCEGKSGFYSGRLIESKKKEITEQYWSRFIELLGIADFWDMPTSISNFGLDGAQWLLEGKDCEKYHLVNRWTPQKHDDYFKCCDYLISLTDLKIDRKY